MIPPVTEETPRDLMLGIAAMLDYAAVSYSGNYAARVGAVAVACSTKLLVHNNLPP